MPVEVLGLHVEREGVRQKDVESCRNLLDRLRLDIGAGVEVGRNFRQLGFAHVTPSC
jgi:hypothetical protein